MTISRGAYCILFQSVLKVKTFLKIFCRENCVNIGIVAVVGGSHEFVVNNVEGEKI
jgi:hypothetical protein